MCFGKLCLSKRLIIVTASALLLLGIVKVAFGDVPELPERPKLAVVSKTLIYSENFQQKFDQTKTELFDSLFIAGCLKANIYAIKDNESEEVEVTAVCVKWR